MIALVEIMWYKSIMYTKCKKAWVYKVKNWPNNVLVWKQKETKGSKHMQKCEYTRKSVQAHTQGYKK